jgi:hypothetical protein
VGDSVLFAVPISEAGTYDVGAHVGRMRDGGNYQLEYSGVSPTGPFLPIVTQDCFTQSTTPIKTQVTTTAITIPASGAFQPGLRYFRFRVIGKAATSLGYELRLAYLLVGKR